MISESNILEFIIQCQENNKRKYILVEYLHTIFNNTNNITIECIKKSPKIFQITIDSYTVKKDLNASVFILQNVILDIFKTQLKKCMIIYPDYFENKVLDTFDKLEIYHLLCITEEDFEFSIKEYLKELTY